MLPLLLRGAAQLVVQLALTPKPKTFQLSARNRVVWTSDTITPNLYLAASKADALLRKTTEFHSLRADVHARSNAPWTDRTGNARSGLATQPSISGGSTGNTYQIDIFHRVPYGIWLEVGHGGKFSIIDKTVQAEAQPFFDTAKTVMSAMFKN